MSDRRSSSLFQLLLLGGLAGLASGGVQAQTFSLVDSSYALTNNLYGSVFGTYRGSVGPLVRLEHTVDSTTLQAYDRWGAPQWGMAIVTDPGVAFGVSYPDPWSVAGLSDGGFILAHWRNWTEFGPSSSFDSTMVRVNVSRFDAAGNVIYSKLLAIAIPELFNSGPVSLRVEPEGTSGGAYVLVLPGGFDSLSDLVYVHRMAPNGDLLWSRWIGHVSSWPGAHPEFVDLQSWEDLEYSVIERTLTCVYSWSLISITPYHSSTGSFGTRLPSISLYWPATISISVRRLRSMRNA